jgi:hypothetical protein
MILLALNELNINYIQKYIFLGKLPNFKILLEKGITETSSENSYSLLEPWIQWVTFQTGLSYDEHKVFRLGDIVNRKDLNQLFEDLESNGLSVGAISPFNADNRLKNPKFFIADPWTKTNNSGGFLISKLSKSISKFVNNNSSGNVGLIDVIWLLLGFLNYVRIKRWYKFFKLIKIRNKPGVKAAILDMILLEVFVTLHKKKPTDYSHLFFNGGAHVQHHYMFNSQIYNGELKNPEWYCPKDWDPLLMILETYDRIIGDLLKTGKRIIGVTGLHQIPHDTKTFYWRPNNHLSFLKEFGLKEEFKVIPRMSRDFLINLNSQSDALKVQKSLMSFKDSVKEKSVFNIDNRGTSLFVEFIYDDDIIEGMHIKGENNILINNLETKLSFVAIKNGKHHEKGYVFSNKDLKLPSKVKLSDLHSYVKKIAIKDFNDQK